MSQELITELFVLELRRREIIAQLEIDGELFQCKRCSGWKSRGGFYSDATRVNGIYPTCRRCKVKSMAKQTPEHVPTETIMFDDEDNTIVGRCNSCRRVLKRNDLYVAAKGTELCCDRCVDLLFVGEAGIKKSNLSKVPMRPKNPQWSLKGY